MAEVSGRKSRRRLRGPEPDSAFNRWVRQEYGRDSSNVDIRPPETEEEGNLRAMRHYMLGYQGNPEHYQDTSPGEKMLERIPPPKGSLAHTAGWSDIKQLPSPPQLKYPDYGYGRVIPLPPIRDYTEDYYRDPSRPHRSNPDPEKADLDPAEQIVNDVIHGKE
jgi:hypothetical protein